MVEAQMGTTGNRLTKAHAERLVVAIDTDALRDTVTSALRLLLAQDAETDDRTVLIRAAAEGRWSENRLRALQSGDADALTQLAVELAEVRSLLGGRIFSGEEH